MVFSFLDKEPKKSNTLNFLFINKVSALVINNILMIIATLTILLGTIYPIIIEVLYNKEYQLEALILIHSNSYNDTWFFINGIAPILSWQTNKIQKLKKYVWFYYLNYFSFNSIIFLNFNTWGIVGLLLGFGLY